jgi:hypothetical protein
VISSAQDYAGPEELAFGYSVQRLTHSVRIIGHCRDRERHQAMLGSSCHREARSTVAIQDADRAHSDTWIASLHSQSRSGTNNSRFPKDCRLSGDSWSSDCSTSERRRSGNFELGPAPSTRRSVDIVTTSRICRHA